MMTPFARAVRHFFKYLYGMDHKVVSRPGEPVQIEIVKIAAHRDGDKVIPSGFFDLPEADNVSAVIFSNEGTIPKFNRMGFDFAKHSGVRMVRVGLMMDFDPSATVPAVFGFLVGDFGEEWGHGMSVYHNPNAKHPIPATFFDGFSRQYRFEKRGGREPVPQVLTALIPHGDVLHKGVRA